MLSPRLIRRTSTAVLVTAVLCVLTAAPALAQLTTSAGDVPTVGMTPTETRPDDPNSGQWFVFTLAPGETGRTKARIINTASVPQTVRLYIADLTFGSDGTATIPQGPSQDVGLWGKFEQESVTLAPKQEGRFPFSLSVPAAAEPGDHVGVVVAESEAGSTDPNGFKVVKRIATRLYVTVPGDATKSYSMIKLSKKLTSTWWPTKIEVTTLLRNTGRVRIHPNVLVGGNKAKGAPTLLARSVEGYTGAVHVPFYGGPVKVPVTVNSDAGAKSVSTSMFVIPWGPLAMIPLTMAALFLVRMLWRLRTRKMRGLQADLRRLEKLVAERQTGESAAKATLDGHAAATAKDGPRDRTDDHDDRVRNIRSGIKRAKRNHTQEPLERLALALHDTGEDALAELLLALEQAEGATRKPLVVAAASYGAVRLEGMLAGSVPADVLALVAKKTTAKSPRSQNGRSPATTTRRRSSTTDRAESGAGTASDSARPASEPAEGAAKVPRKRTPVSR
jgi:hypothetical protein